MNSKRSVQFLSIVAAAMILGVLSPAVVQASYPILKLDFSNNNIAAQTEPGFTSFTTADKGSVVDGIKVDLAGTLDARWRGTPTGIPYELIYRDFIFARPGGMTVTLSGLEANTTYEITIYAYDTSSGSGGDRIADWTANGDFCLTAGFTASIAPVAADDYASTGTAVSDATGTIVLEAGPNVNTTEQSGANNPFAFLNALVVSSLEPVTTARHPVPADGALVNATAVTLEWDGGMISTSSNIYFGEDFDRVSNATPEDTDVFRGNTVNLSFPVGSPGNPYPEGLAETKSYFWRIDEVNDLEPDSPWKGAVWKFTVASKKAFTPNPVDGSLFVDPNVALTWTPGSGATVHQVYFGDNLQDVQAGTGGTAKGVIPEPNYAPGKLELNKMYFWRVDEYDGKTTHTGDVWSFTTTQPGLGTVIMDTWEGITGSTLDLLRNSPDFPNNPARSEVLTRFSTADSVGDDYGARIHGWLYVPLTGNYTFWLSSADQGELWLSTNDDPGNAQLLASEPVWGSYNTFSRQSDPVPLIGGQKYYIMALWKEGTDWDHCQVAWRGPGIREQQIIGGSYLSPYEPVNAFSAVPANGAVDIERTVVLRWKPGQLASEHRVYFGTDPNAVRDADTSSPEYKGTQPVGSETFDPGPLELETSYFWRVDEVNSVNPQSPWVGEVWSFRTGKFLVVDDFESYNDLDPDEEGSNRIYNTWIDGWGTETNGATVGYPNPGPGEHFAETTIVHGGKQAMPFFYDNNLKYSEGVRSIPAAEQDWTREGMGILSLWFRGYPASTGSFVEAPVGTYTMTASGTDITGTADEFHYAYKKLTGAGSITAKVLSVSNTDPWAKAGVMIRETLDPNSRHALACVTPGNGVAFEGRIYTADTSFSLNETQLTAPQWVKLERNAAGEFSVTRSDDGITWVPLTNVPSQVITMDAPTIYIGLAVTAHNATATCEAVFSNVTMTGSVSNEDWMDQDIGILSNTPEPLYVALNDTAVVYHEDPNALLLGQWTEWRIDLKAFADQGVDLTSIDSMAIGVGTKGDISTAGGSGTLYLDDIRLYRPVQAAGQ
jgi:hypothetical protein